MQEIWFERAGVRLHAMAEGEENNPVCLLLHGFPEAWFGWRNQIGALAAAGFRVIAPDGRGYNLSGKPAGVRPYRLEELAADAIAIADALGKEQVNIVAHDWGAAVAWYLGVRYPQRISRLAILNVPHPAVMMRNLRTNPRQMLRSWYMAFFQIPWLPELLLRRNNFRACAAALHNTSRPGTFREEQIEQYREAWRQPGALTGMLNWYRALARFRPAPGNPPKLPMPVSIIWGVHDRFLVSTMAEESLRYCSNGKLHFLENAGHWLQHEEPGEVNRLLIDFLGA